MNDRRAEAHPTQHQISFEGIMLRHALLFIAITLAFSVSAAPTTKPAAPSKPAAKVQPLSERESVLVAGQANKFQIRIPKDWKESKLNPGWVEYDLPNTRRDGTRGGNFSIYAGQLCHPGASLDEQVKVNLETWAKEYKGFKLLKTEPVGLGGVPATAITYDRSYEITSYNAKTKQEKVTEKKERCLAIQSINGDRGYFVTFDIDAADFDMKVKLVNRVLAGFEWLEKPAAPATAPTADVTNADATKASDVQALSARTTKPQAIDPDSTLVEDANIKYRIALPKTWKQQAKTDNDMLFTLPVTKGGFTRLGAFRIGAYPLCQPDSTLDLEVKQTKEKIAQNAAMKVIKEQRTDLAGVPAHMMILESAYEGTITDSRTGTKKITRTQRQLYYLAVRNKALFQISFGHDSIEYDNKLKTVENALKTLEFTDQAGPTTKP
jgi:hypothetical protein